MDATGTRTAECSCGQLHLDVAGDPFVVSLCHCLACQRRTGSAFGVQAVFRPDQVQVSGRSTEYARTSDEADRKVHLFHFCPDCGSTVYYTEPDEPDLLVVMAGAFADPSFPAPTESGYGARRHPWAGLSAGIQRDVWEEVRPLYEAGEYAAVVEHGRALLAAYPEDVRLAYNVACCESLTGHAAAAIEHLRLAIEGHEGLRSLAAGDSDFDPVRDEPAFRELVGPTLSAGE